MRKLLLLFSAVAVLVCVSVLPRSVQAHAVLVRSTPAEGSTVSGPKVHFELQFNSRIDVSRSQLSLSHGPGEGIALHIHAGAQPSMMEADAVDVLPGDYTAHWQALATDGHITRGSFSFHVK